LPTSTVPSTYSIGLTPRSLTTQAPRICLAPSAEPTLEGGHYRYHAPSQLLADKLPSIGLAPSAVAPAPGLGPSEPELGTSQIKILAENKFKERRGIC
jgi:hypothetical protein